MIIHIYSMVTSWIEDHFLWRSSSHCLHSSACLHQVNHHVFVICLSDFLLFQFCTPPLISSFFKKFFVWFWWQLRTMLFISVCVSYTERGVCQLLWLLHIYIFRLLSFLICFLINFLLSCKFSKLFYFHVPGMHPYLLLRCHIVVFPLCSYVIRPWRINIFV